MNLRSLIFKAALALCAAVSPVTQAQIVNGDFATTTFAGWTIPYSGCINSSVGYMANSPMIYNGMGGNWWVDLTGCGWGNGRWIEQSVPTVVGQVYYLDWDLGCWNGQCFTDAGVDLEIDGGLIGRFSHATFTGSWLAWKHFEYCFTATNTSTKIRFTGHGWGTALTPGWANTGGIMTGLGYEFPGVIGIDNIVMSDTPAALLQLSGSCVPVDITPDPPLYGGTMNWYLNGGLISSGGPDTLHATLPGTYLLEYITACGTFTVDTVIASCDTCHIAMDTAYFCVNDSTIFTFDPPVECLNPDCIGKVNIDYGDGAGDYASGAPVRFAHQYPSAGTYTAVYCWENKCTGVVTCDTIVVTIVRCEGCSLRADFTYDDCIPVHFYNTSLANYAILSTHWDFGDGNTSTLPNPVHPYAVPGTYYVCLTVVSWGPGGKYCEETVCKWINARYCEPPVLDGGTVEPSGAKMVKPAGSNFEFEMGIPVIRVSPNPASDNITVDGLVFNADVTVDIYDITGRIVLHQVIEHGKKEALFNVKELEHGTYFIKVKGKNFTEEVKLIKE